jgi:hypothetical protein
MVLILGIVGAVVILAVGLMFYLANGARSREAGRNTFGIRNVKAHPEQRGTGIN